MGEFNKSDFNVRRTFILDDVIALNNLIFPGADIETEDNTYHWIARNRFSGEPIGFCSALDCGHGILFLSRAGLLREYRGRGFQRKFISVRERFARNYGFKIIITYVAKDNHASIASLIKKGYHIYDPDYAWVGEDFTYLRKKI